MKEPRPKKTGKRVPKTTKPEATEKTTAELELTWLLQITREPFVLIGKDLKVISFNEGLRSKYARFFGIEICKGESFLNYTLPDRKEAIREVCNRVLKGSEESYETSIPQPGGELRTFEIICGPARDERREIVGIFISVIDITDRVTSKSYEARLEEINKKLEFAQQIAQLGYWQMDIDREDLYWSREVYHIWGCSPETHTPGYSHLYSSIDPDDRELFKASWDKAVRGMENMDIEHRIVLPDGTVKYVHEKAEFVPDKTGRTIRLEGTVQDVTQRKRSEEAVRTSNERYDLLAKATNDAIWDWDFVTGKVIRTGTGFEKLFGYDNGMASREDDFWSKRVHPEDRARVSGGRKSLVEISQNVYWEDRYRFLKADGHYAYVYDKAYIIRDEKGKALRLIGAMQDFTKDKEQLNEIVRIQGNLYSLINTTTDMIWSVDKDFKIIAANKAFVEVIRTVAGRLVSEGDDVLVKEFGEEMINEWTRLYKRALAGEPFTGEQSFFRQDRQQTWYNIISLSPIIGPSGEVSGVACYGKDITELKRTTEQLREMNIALDQRAIALASSNAELEQFAYIASHDLQEPLRAITSFLQLLEQKYTGLIDETGNKYIRFAVDGAERMKQLILDLLEYSRAGTNKDDTVLTDMNEVVQDVLKNLNQTIQETQARLDVEHLPVLTHARKPQMLQLLQNLISNALKYCDAENPEIKISVKEEDQQWVFSIQDNGIGIEPHHRERIFIIFQRLHNRNEYSGTGIGLSICKKIVEGHGGTIWVDSGPGKGSVFHFSLSKQKQNL